MLEAEYQILGLNPGANIDEVKKAYRKLAKEVHPDKHVGASKLDMEGYEKKFKELNNAYEAVVKSFDTKREVNNNNEIPKEKQEVKREATPKPAQEPFVSASTQFRFRTTRKPYYSPQFNFFPTTTLRNIPYFNDVTVNKKIIRDRTNFLLSKYLKTPCFMISDHSLLFNGTRGSKILMELCELRLRAIHLNPKIESTRHWYNPKTWKHPVFFLSLKDSSSEIYRILNAKCGKLVVVEQPAEQTSQRRRY